MKILAVMMVAACAEQPSLQDDYTHARELWNERTGAYSFTQKLEACLCEYADPIRVTVAADRVTITSATDVTTGAAIPTTEVSTIDGWLDDIDHALGNSKYTVQATFEPIYGYPMADYINAHVPDVVYALTITDFAEP